jgi:hypothetical protein
MDREGGGAISKGTITLLSSIYPLNLKMEEDLVFETSRIVSFIL